MSESPWQEVEPLGIKMMVVEPSGFRTDWAGRSANETKQHLYLVPLSDRTHAAGVGLTMKLT